MRDGPPSALSLLATRTVEAAAHARSRLNPLKGANVEKLVALHEAAAAKLAQQAEELVHEAEHMLFEAVPHIPGLSEQKSADVTRSAAAVVESAGCREPAADSVATATELAATTETRAVCEETKKRGAASLSESGASEPATKARAKAREPSMWDVWYR